MLRLLVLAALAFLAWYLLNKLGVIGGPRPPVAQGQEYEPMARCAGCGTFLPAKTLGDDGRCGACRQLPR